MELSNKKGRKEQPVYIWTEKAERVSKGKRKAGEKVVGTPLGTYVEMGYIERVVKK